MQYAGSQQEILLWLQDIAPALMDGNFQICFVQEDKTITCFLCYLSIQSLWEDGT